MRDLPPEAVFAQILIGFELASADPRFVGLNLVRPEDGYVPMRDFGLHMKMLDYLHGLYPRVHITLHAGELSVGLVPPEGLTFHIRESIELSRPRYPGLLADNLWILAGIQSRKGEHREALASAEEARQLYQQQGHSHGVAQAEELIERIQTNLESVH